MKTSIRFSLFGIALTICVLAFGFSCCKGGNEPQPHNSKTQITPEGGVYTLNNGVTLVVPAGAVDENTTVKVEYAEDLDESKGALPGDIYGQLHFSPEGLIFNKPVEVSMPLNQPAVGDSATIVYWVPDSARWYISDIGCVQNGKVTFYVDHFSDYAAEVDNWMAVFSVMDSYVGSATSEEAISDAVGRYLETELWEKMGIKDLRIATRVNMGGQAVNTCVQACGIYGFWAEVKDSVLVRQGGKMFKEESPCNAYTIIGIHTSYLSSHLYGLLKNGEKQTISDRLLEINYKPCEIRLQGSAKDSKIEKGKTTEVTITAQCGEEPLRDQLIQLQYSPELSCDVVNKKTDANGQVKITVKGVEEGKGIVYAKAVSAADADLVTEIQIPVKVGDGEQWRITLDVTLKSTSSFGEEYDLGVEDPNFSFDGGDQMLQVGFTLVADVSIKKGEYGMDEVTGTISAINRPERFQFNAPRFSQSGSEELHYCHQSYQELSANPIYNDLKDISVEGDCYTYEGKRAFGFANRDLMGDGDYYQKILKNAFMSPNITGTWTKIYSEGSDNGTYQYGLNESNQYDKGFMGCSLTGFALEMRDLKEMVQPFQYSGDKWNEDLIIVEDQIQVVWTMGVHTGIYTEVPAAWRGANHYSVSGTLTIENLSKKQE